MINQTLELGLTEPEETYSSSPHLFEVLNIPTGSTGRMVKAKPVVRVESTSTARRDTVPRKAAAPKKKVERTRTRTKKFK